ncbi:MAG: hypothetical protein K6E91_05335 [Butyrivibrio sp.]|nr:hypothetical protein [Butyrivibrio sp.]
MKRAQGAFMTVLLIMGVLLGAVSNPDYAELSRVFVSEQLLDAVSDTGEEQTGKDGVFVNLKKSYDGRPVFERGMAQPMLVFSDDTVANEDSDILRFCVYVETDHDTDADGMADLVKVFCQVPKGAASGKYKAGVIYDPIPYTAGTTDGMEIDKVYRFTPESFDYDKLYEAGEKRQPRGELNTTGVALKSDYSDWYYATPGEVVDLGDTLYDYFLTRGFAVVTSCGIGTYGSEGYELCGMDLETDCHKCVVEWLAGDRIAYTDFDSMIQIKADFSNGNVAMTGISYGGSIPFAVATTGVKGLKTIIPFSGIASWYDYTNSQGVSLRSEGDYTQELAFNNSGAAFGDASWVVGDENYGALLKQIRDDEIKAHGDYAEIWKSMDYTRYYENIRCSALIVQGLNDFNVRTRNAVNMYSSFRKAGREVKLILHQGAHTGLYGHRIKGEIFEDLMNRWLCHYLYDMDNGIEDMSEVTVQSNTDGSFLEFDSFGAERFTQEETECEDKPAVVCNQDYDSFLLKYDELGELSMDDYINGLVPGERIIIDTGFKPGDVIFGVPRIKLRLQADKDVRWYDAQADTSLEFFGDDYLMDNLMVSAYLVDTVSEGEYYPAYLPVKQIDDAVPVRNVDTFEIGQGHEDECVCEFVQSLTDIKVLSIGNMDLCNPGKGDDMSEYTKDEEFEFGKYYDYTLFFNPMYYEVQPGHELKVVLMAQDLYNYENIYVSSPKLFGRKYSFEVDDSSIVLEAPLLK